MRTNKKVDSHITKTRRAFRRSVPFWKKNLWGNRCWSMWGSYFWLRTTRLYTKWLQMYQRKDGLSHLIQNSTSLSAFGSIFFENFLGNRRRLMWGSYFWLRMTWLYTQWSRVFQRKDRLSHYQKLTSLSAFGFILKDFFFFWKPISVNARVILLVEDDATLYTMVTIVPTKR